MWYIRKSYCGLIAVPFSIFQRVRIYQPYPIVSYVLLPGRHPKPDWKCPPEIFRWHSPFKYGKQVLYPATPSQRYPKSFRIP